MPVRRLTGRLRAHPRAADPRPRLPPLWPWHIAGEKLDMRGRVRERRERSGDCGSGWLAIESGRRGHGGPGGPMAWGGIAGGARLPLAGDACAVGARAAGPVGARVPGHGREPGRRGGGACQDGGAGGGRHPCRGDGGAVDRAGGAVAWRRAGGRRIPGHGRLRRAAGGLHDGEDRGSRPSARCLWCGSSRILPGRSCWAWTAPGPGRRRSISPLRRPRCAVSESSPCTPGPRGTRQYLHRRILPSRTRADRACLPRPRRP